MSVWPAFLFCFGILWIALSPPPSVASYSPGPSAGSGFPGVEDPLFPNRSIPGQELPFLETILRASLPGGKAPGGSTADAREVIRQIDEMAARLERRLAGRRSHRERVDAFNRFLFEEENFAYDPVPGNPDNFLPHRVLSRKKGNCLGLAVVALSLAERTGLALRGVYVPGHCFLRYEREGARINVELADGGRERSDERYAEEFRLAADRPYLRTLGMREMISVYLKSLGAAWSRIGDEEQALRCYLSSAALYPELPDPWYNAGVSFRKLGRRVDAVAHFRKAVELDPDLAPARDNLGAALAEGGQYREALEHAYRAVALSPRSAGARGNLAATLCACGRTEEGIREYLKILEADPANPRALGGVARAYASIGNLPLARQWCERAEAAGCRIDEEMLRAVERSGSRTLSPRD